VQVANWGDGPHAADVGPILEKTGARLANLSAHIGYAGPELAAKEPRRIIGVRIQPIVDVNYMLSVS
jgi:hypothetical protein